MRKLLFLLFLATLYPAHGVVINEIMYDLPGSDAGREWIEVYNNGTVPVNMSGFRLFEANVNHEINFVQGSKIINPNEFAVISDDSPTFLTDWPGFAGNLFDSSFSLSNTGEALVLKNSSLDVIENITYDSSIGADGNADTLCRFPDANESFVECAATPGAANLLPGAVNNTNITANFTGTNSTCDLLLSVSVPNTIIDSGTTLNYDLITNDTLCGSQQHDFTVYYSVEDLFGNAVSGFPKNTTPTMTCTDTTPMRWTPSSITGSEAYTIKANITDPGCNETDSGNNFASQTIIVKGTQPSPASSITINSVDVGSDNEIKYGETADIDISIYKGDTTKYAVDVYVQNVSGKKISEVSAFHANNKFTSYDLSIPVQMKSNCDGSLQDGTYTVVADGLDTTATAPITVKGISSSTCQTVTVTASSGGGGGGGVAASSSTTQSDYELLSYSDTIAVGDEFTTKIKITNNFTTPKSYVVYSYVYKGNTPVSLGYDENQGKWLGTYTANQKSVNIESNSTATVDLKNTIEDGTEPGTYNLRVRIRLDDKPTDVTRQITVTEKKESSAANAGATIETATVAEKSSNETANETESVGETAPTRATGFAAARTSGSMFLLSPISILLEFLSSLLNS